MIGLLRRNVVENILGLGFIKIIGEFGAFPQEFTNGVVEYAFVKQMPGIVFLFTGLRILFFSSVTKEAEKKG